MARGRRFLGPAHVNRDPEGNLLSYIHVCRWDRDCREYTSVGPDGPCKPINRVRIGALTVALNRESRFVHGDVVDGRVQLDRLRWTDWWRGQS